MTYFNQALSRKINLKLGDKTYKVTVLEGIAMNTTNLALKGDPKLLPLVLGDAAASGGNLPQDD